LWPSTISDVWRIEGVIGQRPGGATCAAYHLHTGARVAIDVVRGSGGAASAGQQEAGKALKEEVEALRLIEHSNVLKLVEEGTDRAGIRYLVTDLGAARSLSELLEDWQRAGLSTSAAPGRKDAAPADAPSPPMTLPAQAIAQIGRQILSALSAAHRLGLLHGAISPEHVYVICDEDSFTGLSRAGSVRIHGLRAVGMGPAQRDGIKADLLATGALLYQLAVGSPPPGQTELGETQLSLPKTVEPKLTQVILRGLGANRGLQFGSADEMLRALVVAVPPVATEVSAAALAALSRTDPQGPRPLPLPDAGAGRSGSDPNIAALPAGARMSGEKAALPLPSPLGGSPGEQPLRSRLSGELKLVSFKDLIEQQQGANKNKGEETLARSRRRNSNSSLKLPALPHPPDAGDKDDDPVEHGGPQPMHDTAAISSGEHSSLEPTADIVPVPAADFASSISGPVPLSSSMRSGKSEISLPPQPALPPGAALPEPKSDPPKSEMPRTLLRRSEDSIDPLAQTAQAPIPKDVLTVSADLQRQFASAAKAAAVGQVKIVDKLEPIVEKPATEKPAAEKLAPPAAAENPAPPAESPKVVIAPQQRPAWQWAVLGLVVLMLLALAGVLARK
jgi:serine/threonine protein kinase